MKKKIISIICVMWMTLALTLNVSAATVSISQKTATIVVKGTVTLKLKNANGTIKWVSSNKSVATVNNAGKVTGVKVGNATITATYKKKKYTCKVTVKKSHNPNVSVISKKLIDEWEGSFNRTFSSYDITGDGVNDNIQMIGNYNSSQEVYSSLKIDINGSNALTASVNNDYAYGIDVYYLRFNNGLTYLLVSPIDPISDDCSCDGERYKMYAYKNGKLIVVRDFQSAFSWLTRCGDIEIRGIKASGNSIVFSCQWDSGMIGVSYFDYIFSSSNSFATPSTVTFSWFHNINDKNYLVGDTSKKFPVYKTAGKTATVATIKKGTKFYPLGCKKVGSKIYYYVKVGSKKGYLLYKSNGIMYFKYVAYI